MASTHVNSFSNQRSKDLVIMHHMMQIVGGSLLIALCAQIAIPLPFSPVPITLQNVAVLLLGALFGSRKGALCVVAYLAESMVGLPVIAGGIVEPLAIIGPRGGYLMGFVVQAYLMGYLVERFKEISSMKLLGAFWVAWLVHMTLGVCWLSMYVGTAHVMMMGFFSFIPGAIIKSFFVAKIVEQYHR